jgi:histidinol dehydrogenase
LIIYPIYLSGGFMLNVYEIDQAQETILKRVPLTLMDYPVELVTAVEELFGEGVTLPQAVSEILDSVRREGDKALRKWSEILDKASLDDFHVPVDRFKRSYDNLPGSLRAALDLSAERIRAFHEMQPLPNWETEVLGGRVGQRVTPVERAGVYVPGGTAPLPSSLLMSVIPAQVAGVPQIIVTTPPNPHPTILAAAYICGIEDLYQLGGAQAIAAMAFGSESVPRVDTIVGAGNIFVTLAKQQVFGIVGLDGLFGPTETMVIADENANPAWVAADLLAQAEHDVLASAILLTPSKELAEQVQVEVHRQLENLSRTSILSQSLENSSGIVVVPNLDIAAEIANQYAAEHLCLCVAEPRVLMSKINNAGGFFLGDHSFEVLGDYIAGPSHIMPTSQTARFNSPLNVLDFVKISSVVELDPQTGARLSIHAAEIAQAETLTAHAAAAGFRSVVLE